MERNILVLVELISYSRMIGILKRTMEDLCEYIRKKNYNMEDLE